MTSRTRLLPVVISLLALVVGALVVVAPPGGPPPASAATRVAKDECRRIDPNLVNGVCLRYSDGGGGLTWIGTYRAPDGRIFFCIDFLYDSRLPRRAERVPTDRLVNQLGARVGDREVAALNYVISTWAGRGSTGSDDRDAAIALIVREVMGDGRRPGGLVVYPSGLGVGDRVKPPVGGLDASVMGLARSMWREASALRGPWRLHLERVGSGPVRIGQVADFRLAALSAADRPVRGVRVRLRCSGPVACRRSVTTTRRGAVVRVRPTDVGRFRLVASATGPGADGVLYRQRGWSTHGGTTARPAGVQRGWIAQSNRVAAAVAATARIRLAKPLIVTATSQQLANPGDAIHDGVTVTGLPPGYSGTVVSELHGPFTTAPVDGDCTASTVVGRVTNTVTVDGSFDTPPVVVPSVGWFTWVQRLPGDLDTLPVTTPCGLPDETTHVVPRTPVITTVVSDQRALVGARLFDTVRLTGLADDDTVEVHWRLHGPIASRGTSCAGLGWSRAATAGAGSMTVTGSGTFTTPPVVVRAPGCYTYSQSVLATAATAAAASPPGLAVETSLVTRPVTPVVPEVPTGRSTLGVAPSPHVRVARAASGSPYEPGTRAVPRYLRSDYRAPAGRTPRATGAVLAVPRVGVRVEVVGVGLDRGTVAVPDRRDQIGWLRTTAAPGDVVGASVLSGHVSGGRGGLGHLRDVRRGDLVRWTSAGAAERYEVTAVRRYRRARGLPAAMFRTDGARTVHLVTCSGIRRTPDGRVYFVDNLVVTAVRVG